MKLVNEPALAHSKAFIFVLDEYVKLLKNGFGELELFFNNTSSVTYLLDESTDEVVSAIVWGVDLQRRVGTIHFSATSESHRNNGYYKRLLTNVESSMKNRGVVVFYSGVHVDNETMLQLTESTNRKKTFYRVKKYLDGREA